MASAVIVHEMASTGLHPGYDAPLPDTSQAVLLDARTLILCGYGIPAEYYRDAEGTVWNTRDKRRSACSQLRCLGALLMYAMDRIAKGSRGGRKKKSIMDIDALVKRWHETTVKLATAHDKDEADRVEASIETCLSPILTAPIKQIREFASKLNDSLKADPAVPYLVWRGYERWLELVVSKAPDGDVKELKTGLAREISELVEDDLKPQLGDALIRALCWRSPEQLEKARDVIVSEKSKGNAPRLRGRESCLFLEAGGTEDAPEVCVQI